jgi:hypothetical protein
MTNDAIGPDDFRPKITGDSGLAAAKRGLAAITKDLEKAIEMIVGPVADALESARFGYAHVAGQMGFDPGSEVSGLGQVISQEQINLTNVVLSLRVMRNETKKLADG